MVRLDSRRIPRAPRYSGTYQEFLDFRLQGYHFLWPTIPDGSASLEICNSLTLKSDRPYNPL